MTEREKVQRFDSGTSWLRIERPPRLIVSMTLPVQAWALLTADGNVTVPLSVRLRPALVDVFDDAQLELGDEARDDDVAD